MKQSSRPASDRLLALDDVRCTATAPEVPVASRQVESQRSLVLASLLHCPERDDETRPARAVGGRREPESHT